MVSCCKFLEYAEANKDIFKNQILVKRVYNIVKKNPDKIHSYEELYNELLNIRNIKAKEYREKKKDDKEFMQKMKEKKLEWYHQNQSKVNMNRKMKRDNNKTQCNQQ